MTRHWWCRLFHRPVVLDRVEWGSRYYTFGCGPFQNGTFHYSCSKGCSWVEW